MDSVRQYYVQLNDLLERNGFSLMGDFWKVTSSEIQKTLDVVSYLLKQRGEDQNSKISIADESKSMRIQIRELNKQLEDLKKERAQLKRDKKNLTTQVELQEKEATKALRSKASTEMESKKDISKLTRASQMYQHELKKKENELFRIKKQMTKILDEKTTFSNSYMEIKGSADMKRIAKICDEHRTKGDIEFVEMLKNGFDSTYNVLVEENSQLRGCLLTLQTEMKTLVDGKMNSLKAIKSKFKDDLLKETNMKLYRLKVIEPKAFNLSLNENINDLLGIFKENLDRIASFIDAIINPIQLFQFMDRLNDSFGKKFTKVKNLDDLYKIINSETRAVKDSDLSEECLNKPIKKSGEELEHPLNNERITAKWNTDFATETGEEEGIYKNNSHTQSTNQQESMETSLKKKKVQVERKKWENIIKSEKSNTFFFDSDGSD
ncbi:unnamed protein product [Moneuplotes crassus]|uniref:Uncharacterized protein n=1 Tax=Euplotes crassus TaxID=5936 RepID=A0AAD1UEN5_EUPCR|nr:unnamed protein product [Moneuplotes crassus]